MPTDAQFLISRGQKLLSRRALYEPTWQEIAEYMLPYRANITTITSPGQKQGTKIFDSTAPDALETWASFIHGSMTSSALRWFNMKLRHPQANQMMEIMEWMEESVEIMYQNLRQSNFAAEALSWYLDLGAFGQGCLYEAEKDFSMGVFEGIHFNTFPINAYCIEENHQGTVDTLFRWFKYTARQAQQKFGDQIGEKIKQALEKKPDEEFDFMHCVYPSEEGGGSGKPFASVYVSLTDKKVLSEGGYWEVPYIVPRLRKTSGETNGRGPGHTALADTKTLNKAKEIMLKRWAKELDPPMKQLDNGVIGSVRMIAGGLTTVRDMNAIDELYKPNPARTQNDQIKSEDLKQSIRRVFASEMIESFGVEEAPNETATKSLLRWKLMQMILGPSFGRLEGEGLNPLVERTFGILNRARQLPPPPTRALEQLGIKKIDVEYEGPLARAQRMGELEAIDQYMGFAGRIAEISGPEALDSVDTDEALDVAADVLAVPSRVRRSKEKIQKIRDQRSAAEAEEKQAQDMERMAKGMKDMAPAAKVMNEEEMMEGQGAGMGGRGGMGASA
jgi:hypothetical protein